ncbi:MAG: phosphotransferase [Anaerolineae bacterium]|nr:phosphotransferase [Anaerolineae bacterium]
MDTQRGPLIGRGRMAEVYAWGDDRVLKLFEAWVDPGEVALEAERGRLIHTTGLPVPAVYDQVECAGRLGIVYERVDGPSMLDALSRRPWQTHRLAHQMAALHTGLHTDLHGKQVSNLPAIHDWLRHAILDAPPLPEDVREHALAALDRLPEGDALCHGDFHPGQILLAARGPVIIDWLTAHRGDPHADVARTVILLRFASTGSTGLNPVMRGLVNLVRAWFLRAYLAEYHRLRPETSQEAIEAWMIPVAAARFNEGITTEQEAMLRFLRQQM